MKAVRAIGWAVLSVGLMVVGRDLLLLFDTGRWVPMNLADASNLLAPTRSFSEPAAIAAIWISPVLLVIGVILILMRRRAHHGRAVFRGRFG